MDYATLKIGSKEDAPFFQNLEMTQKGYQKNSDNSISPIYIVNGYQQVGTKYQMVQQQIQLFIDETNTEDIFYDNDTKKESMYVYDENLQLIEEVWMYNYKEPYKHKNQKDLNGFTNIKIKYTYDAYGNLTNKTVGTFDIYQSYVVDNEEIYEMNYTYDVQNNFVIQEKINDGQNTITINYEYDIYGNLIKETRPNENITQYTYSNYFKQLTKVKQQDTTHTLTYENNLLTQIANTKNMAYQYQYNAKEDIYKINYKTNQTTYPLEEYTKVEAESNNVCNLTKGQTGYLVEYNNLNRIGYAYDKYGRIIKQYMHSSKTDQMDATTIYIYGEEKLTDGTSIYEIENETDERIHTNEKSKLRIIIDYYAWVLSVTVKVTGAFWTVSWAAA